MEGKGRPTPAAPAAGVNSLLERLLGDRSGDLLRYIRLRVRAESDARDIAQDTYLRFIRLAKPDVIQNPEAYLFRIAANLIWEHQLRQRQHEQHREVEEEPVSEAPAPHQFAESSQIARNVQDALAELAPATRAVIVMHLRDRMSNGDIAQRLGISVSMVKKHKTKALEHCRRRLRDQHR